MIYQESITNVATFVRLSERIKQVWMDVNKFYELELRRVINLCKIIFFSFRSVCPQ